MNTLRGSRFLAFRLFCASLVAVGAVPPRSAHAQAPGQKEPPELADFNKANDLADAGNFKEAVALLQAFPDKYSDSVILPQVILKLGYVYFRTGNFDKAVEALKKVPAQKGVTPDLAEVAVSLVPQVLSAKAASLPMETPARKAAFEESVKQFDAFLQKYPNSDEAESANYGKSVALYQLARYDEAAQPLKTNLSKYPGSEQVLDSQYLLALTYSTLGGTLSAKPGSEVQGATYYENSLLLLGDLIKKGLQTDLALANDARFQTAETEFARAGFQKDEEKRKPVLLRALEAYRQVAPREVVLQAQKRRLELLTARRTNAAQVEHNVLLYRRLGRVVEKESEKLAAIETRPDQTLAARIKMAQSFLQLTRPEEARILLQYIQPGAEDPEQKKQIAYFLTLSYATQNLSTRGALKPLAEKAESAYAAFRSAYKGDPLGSNLGVVLGAAFVESEPDKAIRYFQENSADYPKGSFRMTAMAQQANSLLKLERYPEALKTYQDALKQNPEPEIAAMAEYGIANIYQKTGKTKEAIAAFRNVRDKYASSPQAEQAAFWHAQLLLQQGDAKAAVAEYQSFLTRYAESSLAPTATYYLGQAQVQAGQRAEALATFRQVGQKFPASEVGSLSYFTRMNMMQEDQKPEGVITVAQEYIAAYPDGAELYKAYDRIAQVYVARTQEQPALETYAKFLQAKPQDPSAPQALLRIATISRGQATALEKSGSFAVMGREQKEKWQSIIAQALGSAEKVVSDYPESPQVALALNLILEIQKSRQQARLIKEADIESYFTALAEKFRGRPATRSKIIFTLAHLYEKDLGKALRLMEPVYDASQKYAPDDLDLYGNALTSEKRYDDAVKVYGKLTGDYAVRANTDPAKAPREVQEAQAVALFGFGKILQEQSKADEAKKKFDELEKLYPWSPKMLEANYGIALALFNDKKWPEALKRVESVTQSRTASTELRARSLLLTGRICEATEDTEGAVNNYIKVPAFYGSVPDAAAEALWRGASLYEKRANGQSPMPTPAPRAAATPKAAPAAKPGASAASGQTAKK